MHISNNTRQKVKRLRLKFLMGRDFVINTGFKFKIKLSPKRDVDRLFYLGHFESATLKLFSDMIKSESIIFDVGANIGIYSLIAAKKIKTPGKIFAFEPSEWAFNRLKENISLNSVNSIELINKAVSNYNGKTDFYLCEDDAYNSLGSEPMQKVVAKKIVAVITLDNFCANEKIDKINILKIDTEGADFLVLKGAAGLLSKEQAPVIFCEYNRYTKASKDFELNDMLTFLEESNYHLYELKDNTLIPFDPVTSKADEIICLKENHHPLIPLPITRK
jgi:FkbM family methyltransferase